MKKRIGFLLRFFGWCLTNFIFWPLFKPVARWLHIFDYLFVVYPGSEADIRSFMPLRFQRIFRKWYPLSVVGVILPGKTGRRGLVIAVSQDPTVFFGEKLEKLRERILVLARAIGVKSIALAGRLPTVFLANRCQLEPLFVRGDRGAVFAVIETFRQALTRHNLTRENTVGVIGLGFLGSRVFRRLAELGYRNLRGYDPRLKEEIRQGTGLQSNNPEVLTPCEAVVILTTRGSDVLTVLPYLRKDILMVDDTHPQMPHSLVEELSKKGGTVYKVALATAGVKFIPRLPRYGSGWIPGCLTEGLVNDPDGSIVDQDGFDRKAEEMGLRPLLVKHRKEG